jgi:hypothetical protein
MKLWMARLLLLTALGLGVGASAHADPVDFSYSWAVLPTPAIAAGTGSVAFAAASGTASVELGSSNTVNIDGAELTTSSSAADPPDSFNAPFGLQLTITDTASGQSDDLTFSGALSGTLTATTSTLTSTLFNPLTQPLTLGDHVYSVTIGPSLLSLPAPGQAAALIRAQVTVTSAVPETPPVTETPEPGTLLLGATAALGLAARRLWKK